MGLSSNWSNNNVTQVLDVIINGVKNRQLSSLVATNIITLLVNFSVMKTHFSQYKNRVQTTPKTAEIYALNARNENQAVHLEKDMDELKGILLQNKSLYYQS